MKKILQNITKILGFSLITTLAHGSLFSISSMKEAQTKLEDVLKSHKAEDIIIAFDIDMTLLQADHPAVWYPSLKKHIAIYKKLMASLSLEKKDRALMLTTQLSQRLVEETTPRIVKEIRGKGIKAIALTASLTGNFDQFKKFEQIRYSNLKQKGIDFSDTFATQEITFKDFPSYNHNYPVFYKGVLCTNGEGGNERIKGLVLQAFLKAEGLHPKIIVMIDDKKKHLETMEAVFKEVDPSIEFIGLEYQGALTYGPAEISEQDFTDFWQGLVNQVS